MKAILIAIFVAAVGGILCHVVINNIDLTKYLAFRGTDGRSVRMISPSCNGTFTCKLKGTKCFFDVSGTAIGLKKGDYVSLLMRLSGAGEWWLGGKSVEQSTDFEDLWVVGLVSVDVPGPREFEARAVVTNTRIPPESKYTDLPSDITSQIGCRLTLQNYIEQ